MLEIARAGLSRLHPGEVADAVAGGAQVVDIRPEWQRAQTGEIPGSLVIERNHLEWRLHPDSDARIALAEPGKQWILYCTEGYASSLAARILVDLGLDATDLIGGIVAWQNAGLPVRAGASAISQPEGWA